MFWMINKENSFQYAHLSGGLFSMREIKTKQIDLGLKKEKESGHRRFLNSVWSLLVVQSEQHVIYRLRAGGGQGGLS